jgi:hypothetical protein
MNVFYKKILLFAVIVVNCTVLLAAQNKPQTVFPSFEPDAEALQYAQKKFPYSWRDLSEMALWASGAQDKNVPLRRIAGAVTALQSDPDLPRDARKRGEYVLTFIHNKYLVSYQEEQTRLDTLLDNGAYNCVSSAVFYAILAVSVNLNVRGVMTHDHAFIFLNVDDGIDIETTNKYGFNPGSQKEFKNDFGKATGYAYIEPKQYRDRALVSQLELVSLILTNRIAYLTRRNRFTDALPILANRAEFLSARTEKTKSPFFADPQTALMDNLLNVGARIANAGNYTDAIHFAVLVKLRYPEDKRWQQFIYTLVYNHVITSLKRNRLEEAGAALSEYASLIDQEQYGVLESLIFDAELVKLVSGVNNSNEAEEALAVLDAPKTALLIEVKRIVELRSFVINSEAGFLAKEKGWLAAIQFSEAALSRYGVNVQLQKNLQTFRANRATELHNTFASLWNNGNHDKARSFLRDALKEFPGNKQLLKDWNTIERLQ